MSKPDPTPPWYLRPLYSRGQFSPRLLMAWQAFYGGCWLVRRWITIEPQVLNGVLVPRPEIIGVLGIIAGLIAALLSLGTYQKVKLGDAAPSPGEIEANSDAT